MIAVELRIGNYVMSHITPRQHTLEQKTLYEVGEVKLFRPNLVKVISDCQMVVCGKYSNAATVHIHYDYLEGIPLTEQWLEKLGFKKETYGIHEGANYKHTLWFGDWHFNYGKHKNGQGYFIIQSNGGYDDAGELDIIETCKYVHQLQNLYFALTGKELTLK